MKTTVKVIVLMVALWIPAIGSAITPLSLSDSLNKFARTRADVGDIRVHSIRQNGNQITVRTNQNLGCLSLSDNDIQMLKRNISYWTRGDYKGRVQIYSDNVDISTLITSLHGGRPMNQHHRLLPVPPLTRNLSRPYSASKGLDDKHIALWGSHGLYFKQDEERWRWQRARLWTTVEDLYTTSYLHSFLVPMLENAGAVVLQPRERDIQTEEIIVDDTEAKTTAEQPWTQTDDYGWGNPPYPLTEGQNPFRMGHYKQAPCKNGVQMVYTPSVTKAGNYAVYISYKSLKNSTQHARYTIVHHGQTTHFEVNQQMGGGTWIYLGTFYFDTDKQDNYIALCANQEDGTVLTADAVRLGGGMGSIARQPFGGNTLNPATVSGYPRFMEGARYYMQYSGIPDSVYNFSKGKNDYTDDFASRGRWVNYLCGGSVANPKATTGLHIPIHLCLALHSDAGTTMNDEIIGTLGIYTDYDNDKYTTFPAGGSRQCNRDLTDYLQTQMVQDIQRTVCPQWVRRGLKNASYSETRNPKVPCTLIEMLSHQNYADMYYGLDPKFQFIVSRALYKGILRFLHEQDGSEFIVQPLPPQAFYIERKGDSIRLGWQERVDTLETTAHPTYYVVYSRQEGEDWDNGVRVDANHLTLAIEKGKMYDFRVCAGNDGGISLPSETLSACLMRNNRPTILIVNGFTRVDAPKMEALDSLTGGILPNSHAISYKENIAYLGEQFDYNRHHAWRDDDDCGFGMCYSDHAQEVTQGNSFAYPGMHGKWLKEMGYSYVSRSAESVSDLHSYPIVDLIMGKQMADGGCIAAPLRQALTSYLNSGGKLLICGSYIGSDMRSHEAARFTENILHYKYHSTHASHNGRISMLYTVLPKRTYHLWTEPNEQVLECEAPDGIEPTQGAVRLGRYESSGITAGIAYQHKIVALPFMLESVKEADILYKDCINYLK